MKTYSIKSWSSYRKTFFNWGRTSVVGLLDSRGYRQIYSIDCYKTIEDKKYKKFVFDFLEEYYENTDNIGIDCVYYIYHTNQSDTFLDIYTKTRKI